MRAAADIGQARSRAAPVVFWPLWGSGEEEGAGGSEGGGGCDDGRDGRTGFREEYEGKDGEGRGCEVQRPCRSDEGSRRKVEGEIENDAADAGRDGGEGCGERRFAME